MHDNPFSPSFSIRPERFFGRVQELDMMRKALGNPDSPFRFLFLTGTRGCGKTSLLHQFAIIAKQEEGWAVIESTYQDCMEQLADFAGIRSAHTRKKAFDPSIPAAGAQVSAFSVTHESSELPSEHLAQAFVSKTSKIRNTGVMVIIDEVQKVAEHDMEEICHAVQAARTAGHNVALVIAGLPAAYAKIRRFPGCTFVQRMKRWKLGMMGIADTEEFLRSMFGLVPEVRLSGEGLRELAEFSGGHPYLLQLLGSYCYDVSLEQGMAHASQVTALNSNMVREAERRAFADYQANVLGNLLVGLRRGVYEYLHVLCQTCDEQSTARTADVASALGKSLQECSAQRARVIDLQLAIPAGRGLLQLALPYLSYAFEEPAELEEAASSDAWIPRKNPF